MLYLNIFEMSNNLHKSLVKKTKSIIYKVDGLN